MNGNFIYKIYNFIKKILIYQPKYDKRFVLEETEQEHKNDKQHNEEFLSQKLSETKALIRQGKRIALLMEKLNKKIIGGIEEQQLLSLMSEYEALLKQQNALREPRLSYEHSLSAAESQVSTSMEENKLILKTIFNLPINKDLVFREISLAADPVVKTMVVYLEGLADKSVINQSVLMPLMVFNKTTDNLYAKDISQYIIDFLLPTAKVEIVTMFSDITAKINTGDTIIFIDGIDKVICIDTKGWEHRSIDRPVLEPSVRGGQSAFTEKMAVNIAIIRSLIRTSDLVTEVMSVGEINKLPCAIMYLKNIVNPSLVQEIKRRIQNVKTDFIGDIGVLEEFIEDNPLSLFPSSMSTERPDRVAPALSEGRIAILVDGNSFVHVVPISLFSLLHGPDDFSIKAIYGTFVRLIRIIGIFMTLMLPGFYLSLTTFHQEAIPTDLLLAIAVARAQVPFPSIVEILLLELSFELIREGVLRIPGIIGPTVGIVGAIILGQAIIQAKIVSPIVVIVVALTGISSFVVPEYRLGIAIRIVRFGLLILSSIMGLLGLGTGILLLIVVLSATKSFGIPYLVPYGPKVTGGMDTIIRGPVYRQERRPDCLNTKKLYRQPHISRQWLKSGKKDD